MDEREYMSFEENLEDDDFGLIVCGVTGKLKGMFIPKDLEQEPVPDFIVELCVDYFGIDPKEFEDDYDDMGEPLTRSIH